MATRVTPLVRTLGEFDAEPELKRQLSHLQKSVQEGFETAAVKHAERPAPSAVIESEYQASFGELVLVDPTTPGSVTIRLPHATSADRGRSVRVKNASLSSNIISIRPPEGATIDGGPAVTITAPIGQFHIMWDGTTWWSV